MNSRTRLLVPLAAAALLALTACGTAKPAASSAPTTKAATAQGGTSAQRAFPGTSGLIADIEGSTLQVQNATDGQVAVTYGSSTTFTAEVAGALSNVTVGSCVTVTPVQSASSGSSGTTPDTAVTASSVRITQPVSGDCTGGFGGGAGFGGRTGGGNGGTRPSGAPSRSPGARPSGAPGGFGGGFARVTTGKVTAISASGFTVEATEFVRPSTSGGASASPSTTTQPVTVTVSGTTTYTATAKSDSSSLAVGKCVLATGKADDTGTIAATTIAVSDAVNGACAAGFGARGAGAAAGSAS